MSDSRIHSRPCPESGTEEFHYRGQQLHCEAVELAQLVEQFGSPLYVYSASAMRRRFAAVRAAFGEQAVVCYAVKANPNLAVLRLFAELGAGFDLVSGGELARLEAAGIDPQRAIFAGAAKQRWEIDAGVAAGIRAFQVESPHELEWLAASGRDHSSVVPVALRINPGVEADTHRYIATARHDSKFGIPLEQAGEMVAAIAADPHLSLCGYHVHLGSQLHDVEPYRQALERVAEFLAVDPERRQGVTHYDLGGGFAISYGSGPTLDLEALAGTLLPRLRDLDLLPMLEPGRYLVGDAGVLLTRVVGTKCSGSTEFLLVDAAMNDLLRPSLYQAEHPIVPLHDAGRSARVFDVVGPVCESGDFLALGRQLPELRAGELLAVLAAGAYGAAMASNYNSRARPAEVMIDGADVRLIRGRESLQRLWMDEVTS